ncbi:MAG TPA: mycothiol system anti-sigma-R factor [Acidimicrobiales bacterium]
MAEHHDHDHDHATDCEAALAEIYTFLDGELTQEKRVLIAHHLEGCNPCIEAFDFEAELRIVISTKCREEVPESLRVRIAQKLTMLAQTDQIGDGDEGPRPVGA